MLSVKQGSIKYHFLCLWYNSTWDWTQISWTIGKHSNHYANFSMLNKIYKIWMEILNEFILDLFIFYIFSAFRGFF